MPSDAFVPTADASIVRDAAMDDAAVTDDAPASSDAGATPPQRVFVTEGTYTGALMLAAPGGIDRLCADAAEAAGLDGMWVAWLSTGESSAIDRIAGDGPFVDMAGVVVFPSRAELATGPVADLSLDEHGGLQNLVLVWTGTTWDGTSSGNDCEQWHSASADAMGTTGQTGSVPEEWTRRGAFSCDELAHLYCFERR